MDNKLLQPLLRAGLLDIGDSDERLASIERSIADLQQKITENHLLIERYTLTGMDPEIPQDEITVIEVEDIIAEHWKALRAKFSERPIAIIRAVILCALYNAGNLDVNIARIIYFTASNFFPFGKFGREKEIVERMISELGDLAEAAAIQEWSLNETELNLKVPALKITGLQFGAVSIDDKILKSKLTQAGKHTPEGHQQYNYPEQWSTYFATHASEGIVNAIQTTVEKLGASLSPASIETPLNKYFAEFKKSLENVLKDSLNSLKAVERRSKLLWWKEALYSASLKNSYRVLSSELQPLILACDLFDQLPPVIPVSVDYLLRDTLLLINKGSEEKTSFSDFFNVLLTVENKKFLRQYFDDVNISGRISLTDFINLAIYDKTDIAAFRTFTGIDIDAKLTYGDIAVIVLHDLFINYLGKH